ncbi:MAG: CHRD domain-containing protein [Deltaproteobacteria bacterium]|nr:CHRD domain-containing protein [Deltaproteobacteria bacterium]MCL5277591.1 CHRD domain-containing protein [Deltaproteobacteria bacterium]
MTHKTAKSVGTSVVLAVATFVLASTAGARSLRFTAYLSGKNIVPQKVDTKATGKVVFSLSSDGKGLSYRLMVRNIDNVTMAHIHMESADRNGPPVAWLYPRKGMAPMEKAGRFNGTLAKGTITANELIGPLSGKPLGALIDGIRSGKMYVVVHTTQHPDGEIRGLIK